MYDKTKALPLPLFGESDRSPVIQSSNRSRLPENIASTKLITVDVFDTILLRKPVAERRRFFKIAKAFASRLPNCYKRPSPELVYGARAEAQRWAYRALDTGDQDGEIKILDIFTRQLLLLGLPAELASLLLEVELQVESSVLVPNRPLIRWLKLQRSHGIPVIAISDTTLSAAALQTLIESVAGPNVVDRIYTSADVGLSKRNGGLFAEVAAQEKRPVGEMTHFGDDRRADAQKALAAGLESTHLPRTRFFLLSRKADGLLFEASRVPSQYLAPQRQASPLFSRLGEDSARVPEDKAGRLTYLGGSFGYKVLGPILARYCSRLWIYLSFAEQLGGNHIALFCARGGLNLRVVFEAFLEHLQLPLKMPRADFMVSRLVAARAALLANSPSALEEIAREYGPSTMATVARSLAQSDLPFDSAWDLPFDREAFLRLMNTTAEGAKFRQRLVDQNSLFESYLQNLTQEKERLVLCDTGLYGSTLRLLRDGFPARKWESLLFARCNYKGFVSAHFNKTVGIMLERNFYDPLHLPSTVLRYWQFIEGLFEPDVESVRTFARAGDGSVASNLETADWRERLATSRSPLLDGALSYIADLPRNDWFGQVSSDEPASWLELRKAILFPTKFDLPTLSVGSRSLDFGKDGTVKALSSERPSSLRRRLMLFRTARWKEGLVAQEYPGVRVFIQAALESSYVMRWLIRRTKLSALRRFH